MENTTNRPPSPPNQPQASNDKPNALSPMKSEEAMPTAAQYASPPNNELLQKQNNRVPQQSDMSHIKGWGIDANPKNDPTYPMRQRTDDSKSNRWQRPPLQPETVEVLKSIERPTLTSVYGTSSPPKGLSGMIRRLAFKFSEGSIGHWLYLLLADRVNMVEGVVSDVAKGQVPNFFVESGMKAQWKHKPEVVVEKVLIGIAVVGIFMLLKPKKSKKH